jgi:23S rRNA (guanosine2251-2'-O)-methyltransferase
VNEPPSGRDAGTPTGRKAGGPAEVVGGRRAVVEAIRSGGVEEVVAARGVKGTQGLREVISAARTAGLRVRWVDRADLERFGLDRHQGVAAVLTGVAIAEPDYLRAEFPPDAMVVVLDGVTDPQNLGACARAAEAAGASMLVTRKRRAAPLSPAAMRASSGALAHLPVAVVTNIRRSVDVLKGRGFHVVGLDHRAAVTIHDAGPAPRPIALVVGSEDKGISRLVREGCDLLVSIPLVGRTASLNASAALAVALFGYVLRPEP